MLNRPVFWRQALAALLSWAVACPAWGEFRPTSAQTGSVPIGILYQGRLERDQLPVNETVSMTFNLFTVPTGGALLWTSGANLIPVVGGAFMAYLNIPDGYLLQGTTKFIELVINDVPPVTLAPRDPVRSVPFAKIAETVEGTQDISMGGLRLTTPAGDALAISSDTGRVGIGTIPGAVNGRLEIRPIVSDKYALFVAGSGGTKVLTVNDPAGAGVLQLTTPLGSGFGGTGTDLGAVPAGAIAYFPAAGTLGGSVAGADTSRILCSGGAGAPTWCRFDSANTPSTLVARDGSGDFSAGTITATLSGSLTGTAALAANLANGNTNLIPYQTGAGATAFVTAGANGDVLSLNGSGVPAWTAPTGLPAATANDLANGAAGQLPYQNAPGDTAFLGVGTIGQILTSGGAAAPSWVTQNTLTAQTAAAWQSNGSNCAAGNAAAGVSAAGAAEGCSNVATQAELDAHANNAAHGATWVNTPDTIVRRDPSGNFSAGTITATLDGPAAFANSLAANGSDCGGGNSPAGFDAFGNAEGCFDAATQGELDAHTPLTGAVHGATTGTASTIVLRDGSGSFTAGTISAALNGTAQTASAWAANGTNCAAGNSPLGVDALGGTEGCFDAATQAELDAHASAAAHGATAANTVSQIVARDGSGSFTAGTITAALSGLASSASGLLANGSNCVSPATILGVDASGAANCFTATTEGTRTTHEGLTGATGAHSATSANTASTLVARSVGNFSAGTINAALNGNATTASAWASNPSNCAADNTPLGVDAGGVVEGCWAPVLQADGDTHSNLVGASAHGAASGNSANMIVTRDGSGNFSAGSVTLAGFLQLPMVNKATLQSFVPGASGIGKAVGCSNCGFPAGSVSALISTGAAAGQFATLGSKAVPWQ